MIIKRVVVQGFKTYAKKTEFEFDPGVTAIVGPNGSGKSNVVDAIRWCLGEQSFSLLRSKKTSDVIFSGSDRKSRLGMALVTVALDNSSGELPLEFTEVEITRRAYRDGENEYLLNGQRVRLQDITEILASTGLGKRTYALIGQGLIERVLSMAPGELRTLFEEAAGITTSQSKRAAALRRLEAAQLNLTRVKDITAEISPRLGYLRRQAERAEERNRIADELRDLLMDWYGYHWHAAQRRLAVANTSENEVRARVQSHRNELSELSSRIERQRGRQAGLRIKVGDLHNVSSERHRKAEQLGRELAVTQERLRQLTERAEASRQELAPLRLQRETLTQRIDESEQTIQQLQDQVAERLRRVELMQMEISVRSAARHTLDQEVDNQRSDLADLRAAVAQTSTRKQQLEERRDQLTSELGKVEAASTTAAESVTSLNADLAQRRDSLQEVETRLAGEQANLEKAESAIAAARKELEEATVRRQSADREADRLQTRLDLLSRLRSEGAGYANGVRAVLQAGAAGDSPSGSPNRLSGIRGTVASCIRVPAGLDTAIETAVGGAYQNVITSTWRDAQSAIDYLTATGSGRVTFLPLDRLHVLDRIPAPSRRGILGNAADLVEFDADVSEAIMQLLNRVWIAEDLDAARTALDSISSGPRPTVVTITGEIVRPGGSVTGGTDNQRRDNSILARERELRDLPASIDKAVSVAQQRASQCAEIAARIEQLNKGAMSAREAIQSVAREERTERAYLAELESEVERALQASRWHAERAMQIHDENTAAEQKILELEQHLADLAARQESAETSLAEAERAALQSGIDPLLEQLADLRTAAAEVQGELQSQTAVLENRQRNLDSTDNQIASKEQQVGALEAQARELAAVIEQLDREEQEISAEISSLLERLRPDEAALQKLEMEQSLFERTEREMQVALRQNETEWNTAQLEAQRAGDGVDRLRHDIEQEFGLILMDESQEAPQQPPLPWDAIIGQLPALDSLPQGVDEKVSGLRAKLGRLRNINPEAPREYAEAAERCEFLENQAIDLETAIRDLHEVITRLNGLMESELQSTFSAVAEQFEHYFQVLFNGGSAKLTLEDPSDITTSGIEVVARPPGKRPQSLALLSGGERTLAACALIFAILRVSPTPFCVLDEVDAALDEANVDRFRFALEELSRDTQFILITHNRRTLEGANAIYGVTMGDDGTSRVISLKLEDERQPEANERTGNSVPSPVSVDQTEETEEAEI